MQGQTNVALLKVASALVVGLGVLIAAASWPPAAGVAGLLLDAIFWPLDGGQSVAGRETRLVSAIGGGVMVGWGIMLWLVSTRLYHRDPALARTLIISSVVAWFVVDSLGSVAAGAPVNAALNIGFLAAFILPLSRSRP